MGQACCADDIQVQYKPNIHSQQSGLSKHDPVFMHVPQQLPIVQMPQLNDKVQKALSNMKQFHSEIQNYQRGVYSRPRRINALGVIYQGEWKNMSPHGKGKMYFPDGSYYQGFFFNGVPDGEGRLINSYGISYEGQVKNGKATGQGQLINLPRQYHYQGQWRQDIPQGFGKQTFGQISYYQGNFNNGVKEGQGIYKKSNDFQYKGNFINNLFDGYGQIFYVSGESYAGNWKHGVFHGQGTYFYTNKQNSENSQKVEKYVGSYQDGLKHGKGKYTDIEGRIFQGVWEFGKRKGKGKIFDRNEIIEWNWNNDKALKKSKG